MQHPVLTLDLNVSINGLYEGDHFKAFTFVFIEGVYSSHHSFGRYVSHHVWSEILS